MGKKLYWKEILETVSAKIHFLQNHMDLLKKIALPVVVGIAVLTFWIFGGENADGSNDGIRITDGPAADISMNDSDLTEESGFGDETIFVDIGGEVEHPGVYQIAEGTRLFQVIEMAGGLKESAASDSINQAEPVSDGQKIIIGSLDETSPYYIGNEGTDIGSGDSSYAGQTGTGNAGNSAAVRMTQDGMLININLATLEELQLIPGVGPSTAQKIINYRSENGSFGKPEDLKKISGIGEKIYENLKDYIET